MRLPRHRCRAEPRVTLRTAACGDDSTGEDNAAETSNHTVEHAMGTTVVPAEPDRAAVLGSSFLDAAPALDVIGATEAPAGVGMPDYLADRGADIEVVGLTDEPNLEPVASLRPDMILGAKVRHEELYDELADIAPTVFMGSPGTNWKDGLAITAENVGAASTRFSMARLVLPDEIRLHGPNAFSASVLTDVVSTVADGRVQGVDDDMSMRAVGPIGAGLILDDELVEQ